MPYGDIEIGQHWLRHQAITGTNVDLSSVRSCGIHLRLITDEMLKISLLDVSLKIIDLKLQPHLPGASEFIYRHLGNDVIVPVPLYQPWNDCGKCTT